MRKLVFYSPKVSGRISYRRILRVAEYLIICSIMSQVSFASTFDKKKTTPDKFIEDLSDEQVVQVLSSPKWWDADRAVLETLRRGERMISPLLKNRGNTMPFRGYRLGMENPEKPFPQIPKYDTNPNVTMGNDNPTGVNVEVASLFLINAVYYDELGFAPYPHLLYARQAELWEHLWRTRAYFPRSPVHLIIPPEEYDAYERGVAPDSKAEYNSPRQVWQAWESVERWNRLKDKKGLRKLRETDHDPLKYSGVRFVYVGIIPFRLVHIESEK